MRSIFCGTFLVMLITASAAWAGEFQVAYPEVSNPDYAEFRRELQEEKFLESIADDLNSFLNIPADVTLAYEECEEENAFYDPEKQQITMCYEIVDASYDLFSEGGFDGEELDRKVWNSLDAIFYHELGHALIHVLDLPITGKEEDAADQLSAYILLDGSDEGTQAVLDAAIDYFIRVKQAGEEGESPEDKELAMADEHSMDAQRFYNFICWVYGENPEKHAELVKSGTLPESRAVRCPGEWSQIDKAWSTLLAGSIKEGE